MFKVVSLHDLGDKASDVSNRVSEVDKRPAFRVCGGVAEGLGEQGGDEGAGGLAGGISAAADRLGPVQQSHDPPLFLKRW